MFCNTCNDIRNYKNSRMRKVVWNFLSDRKLNFEEINHKDFKQQLPGKYNIKQIFTKRIKNKTKDSENGCGS